MAPSAATREHPGRCHACDRAYTLLVPVSWDSVVLTFSWQDPEERASSKEIATDDKARFRCPCGGVMTASCHVRRLTGGPSADVLQASISLSSESLSPRDREGVSQPVRSDSDPSERSQDGRRAFLILVLVIAAVFVLVHCLRALRPPPPPAPDISDEDINLIFNELRDVEAVHDYYDELRRRQSGTEKPKAR
jgi:hypothetical protein